MQIPNYEDALAKHETPLDVFVSRWEPVDGKSYKKGFREDLAALIAYIEAAQTKRAADECQSHAWNKSHTGFKFCPDCGNPLTRC